MINFDGKTSIDEKKIVLSGKRKVGKTHIARQCGYQIFGVADPMYKLAEYYMGTSDKSKEGVREFLQNVGAVGRGDNPEQDVEGFSRDWEEVKRELQHHGHEITEMVTPQHWALLGTVSDFWVRLLCERIKFEEEGTPIAVPNGRFPDEINRLWVDECFRHLHVMCSEETRRRRLIEAGEDPDAKTSEDITEQLAGELDLLAQGKPASVRGAAEGALWPELYGDIIDGVVDCTNVVWSDPDSKNPFRTV